MKSRQELKTALPLLLTAARGVRAPWNGIPKAFSESLRARATNLRARALPYLSVLIGAGVGLLLCVFGIAAVVVSMPVATRQVNDPERPRAMPTTVKVVVARMNEPPPSVAESRLRGNCEECGMVESTREILPPGEPVKLRPAARGSRGHGSEPAKPAGLGSEVVLRMRDGTSRAFGDTSTTRWRPGERVIVLESRPLVAN